MDINPLPLALLQLQKNVTNVPINVQMNIYVLCKESRNRRLNE